MVGQEDNSKLVGARLDGTGRCGSTVLADNRRARRASVEDGDRVPATRGVGLKIEVSEGQLQ